MLNKEKFSALDYALNATEGKFKKKFSENSIEIATALLIQIK